MQHSISFVLDGKIATIDFQNDPQLRPTTTVLNYLRCLPNHKGVKEGCAEGDCGACTVVTGEVHDGRMLYKSIDSCLVFLPMIHGKQLVTVENLGSVDGILHPVQQAMVDTDGSQCGYCTPGFIMSLFSLYKNHHQPSREKIDDALTGNLCRCTGYRPIVQAAAESCVHQGKDTFTTDEGNISSLLQSISKETIVIRTGSQTYYRPVSVSEAVALKHAHPNALIINGATDIALRVTKRHELLNEILDLSEVEELKEMREEESSIVIGSGSSLNDVMRSVQTHFPALYTILSVFGSQQIRNLATLGGNLGTASPIGDTLPVLMAYRASILLESLNGHREVPFDSFITGYRQTVRKADELITGVRIPKMRNGAIVRSYKISKRKDLDISTVSCGFRLELDPKGIVSSIVLAYGGMAERIKHASNAEQFLVGKRWERRNVEQAMPLIEKEFTPISDARAGAEMRKLAAKNLLMKFWVDTKQP